MEVLLLIGPPGSGKGTQAKLLESQLGYDHISTGDLIRAEIKSGSALGERFSECISQGKLVDDRLIFDMLQKRLTSANRTGIILDGFPRTPPQAILLDELLHRIGAKIVGIFSLNIEDEVIVNRLSARLFCSSCGASFNKHSKPPKLSGICDLCGGELSTRTDDIPDVIRARLKDFARLKDAVTNHYHKSPVWLDLDATQKPEEICDRICVFLKNIVQKGESKA